MNANNIENKLKKRSPHIYIKDFKFVDPLDIKSVKNRCSKIIVKDLYMIDIQAFIAKILCNNIYKQWPRWCDLLKPEQISNVNLIVVEGMSSYVWSECLIKYGSSNTFQKYFELMSKKFNGNVRFVNPSSYGVSWKYELFEVPHCLLTMGFQSSSERPKKISLKRKHEDISTDYNDLIVTKVNNNSKTSDLFPRTQLLLSIEQMEEEHIYFEHKNGDTKREKYKYSIPTGYKPVTDSSPIYAIDCEMVECIGDKTNVISKELASVSIINEKRETVYHKYVKPSKFIVNYLTKFSGITPEIMEGTSTTLKNVQEDLSNIIPPDAILAGHSIGNDLSALQLFHPYLIDTSIIYNRSGIRKVKPKLRALCSYFLNREIQDNKITGHDSLEDAMATMDLILLKLANTLDFGDEIAQMCAEEDENDANTDVKSEKTDNIEVKIELSDITVESSEDKNMLPSDSVHMRHKQFVDKIRASGKTANLLTNILPKLNNPVNYKVVATVNDCSGFTERWFPDNSLQQEVTQKKSIDLLDGNRRNHSLNVSEVSGTGLSPNELPSKKWMTKLLKKVVEEFDNLSPNSFCGLIFTDGACDSANHEGNLFGQMHFGIRSMSSEAAEL